MSKQFVKNYGDFMLTPMPTHRATLDISFIIAKALGYFRYDRPFLYLRVFNFICLIVNWGIGFTYCSSNVADIIVNYNNLDYVSNNLGYLAPMITTFAKTFNLYFSQDRIKRLIHKVHSPIELLKYSSDPGVLTNIRTAIFYQNFDYCLFNGVTISVTYVTFFAIPRGENELPLRGTFPFDVSEFPIHQLIYFVQIYTIYVGCIWVLVFDTTVLGLIRWTYVQLIILKNNYRHCSVESYTRSNFTISPEVYKKLLDYNWFTLDKEKESKINKFIAFTEKEAYVENDSFELRFATCLKHHQRLIKNVNECNDTFSAVLFGMIAANFFLICFNLFLAVLCTSDPIKFFRYMVMMATGLLHLLFWCLFGNELMKQGESVYESIYDSRWEEHSNPKVNSFMINALIRAMKPLTMSAGKFFIFSMETYLSVIQKSYSYFAILNSVIDKDDYGV